MTKTRKSREGYLLIDNSHAPPMSVEEACATGKPVIGAGVRGVFETAFITCSHCQGTVILNPDRTRERAWCYKCDHYICDACAVQMAAGRDCTPMRKILNDAYESANKGIVL
jgi:hypothetical protein